MTLFHLTRRNLLLGVVGGATGMALAAGSVAPWEPRHAEAQVDPSQPATDLPPAPSDPALAGEDPSLAGTDPAPGSPDSAPATLATPVVTPEVSLPAPTWEPTEAGMSTSLGGSDIAVASEGGSHQIDAPKRKVNKILGEKKRP